MKRPDKINISTIIHDLKYSYSKVFRETIPQNNQKIESFLIDAAKKVKKGAIAQWYLDGDEKRIKFIEARKRWRY